MSALRGLRVLAVEDETLIAMLLEDMLTELGCIVAASAASLTQALREAESGAFDVALLDVNIAGERVFPVADALKSRGIPFAFATGYGEQGLRDDLRDHPVISKPYTVGELERALTAALAGRAAA